LGTYSRGNDVSLTAEITAPASLGNEYQNAIAKVDWVFTGNEVKKDKGDDPTYEIIEEDDVPLANLPQTGRSSGAIPMMGAVLLGAGVILRTRDGKKDK
ncbi:MAG: LPXTG cell wall anchor domain-containing protein, partial [Oscillospiraceae bacterium]|nr:LPXTG cell wall anchor domain-containing protein [Oscillospiraceae bacterium]